MKVIKIAYLKVYSYINIVNIHKNASNNASDFIIRKVFTSSLSPKSHTLNP